MDSKMKPRLSIWLLCVLGMIAVLFVIVGRKGVQYVEEQHNQAESPGVVIERSTQSGERLFKICNEASEGIESLTVYLNNDTFDIGKLSPEESWEESPINTDLKKEINVKVTGRFVSGRPINDELKWSMQYAQGDFLIIRIAQSGKIY